MARSVSYQSGAEIVKYCNFLPYSQENGERLLDDCEILYIDRMENILSELENTFKSFERVPDFNRHCYNINYYLHTGADRECYPVLKNGVCAVFASEYCGVISLSFCPLCIFDPDDHKGKQGIQKHWIQQAENKINDCIERAADRVFPVGRLSNGEQVFCRVKTA